MATGKSASQPDPRVPSPNRIIHFGLEEPSGPIFPVLLAGVVSDPDQCGSLGSTETVEFGGRSPTVKLSMTELVAIHNALNEVCNGVRELSRDAEFGTRLGGLPRRRPTAARGHRGADRACVTSSGRVKLLEVADGGPPR
jgi:hypothetical protein